MKNNLVVIFITLLISFVGSSQPSNDNCTNPTIITPSSDCSTNASTLKNATSQAPLLNNDVWFSFKATSSTHSIGVVKTKDLNVNTTIFKPNIELFASCGSSSVISSQAIDGSTQTLQQDMVERTYVNLAIGTTYFYRVFNIGSGSTLFNFDTYVCETINSGTTNDELVSAINLNVTNACNLQTYSITGATASSPAKNITGTGYQNADVWFKATVPSNGNLSIILQNLGLRGEFAIALYKGTSYSNIVEVGTDVYSSNSTSVSIYKTGLTPNDVLYVRVCSLTGSTSRGTFKICASTPPVCGAHTPAGDNCSSPTKICDLNGYCGNTSSTYTIDEPSNLKSLLSAYQSTMSIENNSWLSFTANSTSATFTIYVSNCIPKGGANGIQMVVLDASNCSNFVLHSNLWSPGTVDNTVLTATNLVVGNDYLIMVDGAAGASCDYLISTNSGVQLVDAGPDQVYCDPSTVPLELSATGTGFSTLTWSSREGVNYSPNIGSTALLTLNPGPKKTTQYIVEANGTCQGTRDSVLVTVQSCLCTKPVINTMPIPITTCTGSNASFSVSVTGATKYQWKESKDGGLTFSPITDGGVYSGSSTQTLVLTGLTSSFNTYKYKCVVTDLTGFCSDSTSGVLLSISPLTPITTNTVHICQGTSATVTATSTPQANYTYVWTVPSGFTNPGNVNSFTTSVAGEYTVNIFTPSNLLCNDDFELPVISGGNSTVSSASYQCWKSTTNQIEIWKTGFVDPTTLITAAAYSGNQFIEINASTAGTLYQDNLILNAGMNLTISFAHRGRKGIDVMKVYIGPTGGPYSLLGTYSTDKTAWVLYNVNYTVPASGNYSLRFESVSSSGGDQSYGNFIDAITVKTGVCSIASSKTTVIVDPLPTATISGTTTVCKNDPSPQITLTGANSTPNYTFSYSINNGATQTITSSGNIAQLSVPTGIDGVFVYDLISVQDASSKNCSQLLNSSVTITVNQTSLGGTVTSDHTICIGNTSSPMNLTGNNGNITKWQSSISPFTVWNDVSNTTNTLTSGILTQTTKFRAAVKNETCPEVFSSQVTVNVDPLSIAGTLNSDKSICINSNSGLLNLNSFTGNIVKWQSSISPFTSWNDISNTTNTFTSQSLNETTKFQVVVKSGLCPSVTSNPITISIEPEVQPSITCGASNANSISFNWTDIPGATSYNYTYKIGTNGIISSLATFPNGSTTHTINGLNPGSTVYFTLTPVGILCPLDATKVCSNCSQPTISNLNVVNDFELCIGEQLTLKASEIPSNSNQWTVSDATILSGNILNPFDQFQLLGLKEGVTDVNFVNDAGCLNSVQIKVNPDPIVDAGNDGIINCIINQNGLSIGPSPSNSFTYQWTPSLGLSDPTLANPIANPSTTTSYSLELEDKQTGCKNSDEVTVTINKPSVTSNAGADATITCIANVNGVSIGEFTNINYTYSWSPTAGLSDATISNPTANPSISQTYTLTKTENTSGCTDSDDVIVSINKPSVIANAGTDGMITCISNSNGITLGAMNNVSYSYSWTPITGLSSSTISNPLANPTSTTNYTLTVTDISSGCSNSASVNISVNKPVVVVNAGIDNQITCVINPSGLTIGESPNINYTYAWLPTLGLSDPTVSNPLANPTLTTTYTLTATDISSGCTSSDNIVITYSKPTLSSTAGNDATITCITNTNGVAIGGGNNSSYAYNWSPTIGLSDATISNPVASPVTSTTYTLTTTEIATGCTNVDDVVITVNKPTVTAVAGSDGAITCVSNVNGISIGDVSNPNYSYAWLPVTGLTSSNASNPNASPSITTSYTLTTTDISTGCFGTDDVTITVNKPTVVADAGLDGSITCSSNVSGVIVGENSNVSFTYAWSPSDYLSDANSSNPIALPLTDQTYTVTKTDISSGCFDTDEVTISVNKPIIPVSAGSDAIISCLNNTNGLIIGENNTVGFSYSWSPSTDLSNPNVSNPNASPSITTTYTLTKTEIATGCIGTDDVIITLNKPILNANAGNDSPITCVTNNSGVTIGSANNVSYSYLWTPSLGLSSTTVSNPIATPTNTTTYTVTTTDISSGCVSTDDVIISVDKVIPIANAGNDDFVSCISGTASLDGINSSGGLNYSWTTNAIGAQIGNASSQTTTTNKEGNYTLTVTNPANGCFSTDQVTITLHTYPTVNPSSNSPICENQDLNLSTNSLSNVIYQWSGPNGFLSSTQSPNITTASPNATGDYILVVTDVNGCSTTKTVSIIVNSLPTLNVINSGPICIDANSFTLNETLGNGVSWEWTTNGNATISATNSKNPTITNAVDGDIFSLTLTDVNGCVNTANTTIKINKLPIVIATNSGPICDDVTSFTVNETGGEAISWKWTTSGNATFSNPTQKNPTVSTSITNETFTVEGKDINGCISKATTTITINPLPQFTVSDNHPCDSSTLLLTTNYTNAKSYLWNGPNGFISTVQNPIINTADIIKFEGNYTLKVTDNNDCSSLVNHPVDIIAKDNIQFIIDTTLCQHDGSKLLKANFDGTWSGDGIVNSSSGLFNTKDFSTKYMPSKNLVMFNSIGAPCPNTKAISIHVYKNPSVDFEGNTELCEGDTLSLINLSLPLSSQFNWDFGNGIKSNSLGPKYVYTQGGNYSITLKATANGCDSTFLKKDYIHVVSKPKDVNFQTDKIEIDPLFPEVNFTTTTEANYYYWNFGDGSTSHQKNPNHTFPTESGEYLVTLTASSLQNGCSNVVKHAILVLEPTLYYIPNTFTPNGDELNNVFQPVFTSGYDAQHYSFYIYNRWGELIFESHDPQIGWDGTFGNNLLMNDTFIWKLEFKEKIKDIRHVETGHVNLIR